MDREFYESEIRACKQLLQNTDYIDFKIVEEGESAREQYAPVITQRAGWRVRINEMEALIRRLNV